MRLTVAKNSRIKGIGLVMNSASVIDGHVFSNECCKKNLLEKTVHCCYNHFFITEFNSHFIKFRLHVFIQVKT